MRCSASWSASSLIELVRARMLHTVVARLPGRDSSGTRVHAIPESLATSIAATRAKRSSSSESTWTGLLLSVFIAAPLFFLLAVGAGCPRVRR
jgi:hypothetical protein